MTDNSTQGKGKTWLYLIVFLTGASVMIIELLGTRLIAPFYGASLYVWTSLISVTMIALAIGYFVAVAGLIVRSVPNYRSLLL
jgi:predicted membrane-bound spermidine synthase